MAIGITVAGSVVIGSGVGIPFDNITATAVTGTKTILTGVSQNFSTIDVDYGMAPITYAISPSLSISGLTFNTGNGNITGSTSSTTAGISYAVTATDQYSRSASASFTLIIEQSFTTTLVIASRTVTAGVNETGFVPVTAQGGTAPVTFGISPSITGLGLSFNSSNGAISGNATSTITATPYLITATDATSQTSSKTFTMTVAAPAFSTTQAIASRTLTVGTADSFTPVTATGGYGTLVWSISPALPSNVTLNTANGLISGTPTVTSGSTTYTVTVTDGLSQTSSKTFSMTVNAPALTTTLAISSRIIQLGNSDSFTPVTASGGYSTLTWSISPALPSGLSLTTSNGLISGTPAVSSPSTSYTVTVTDTLSQTSSKSFTLLIAYTAGYTVANVDPYANILALGAYIDPLRALFFWGNNSFGQLATGNTVSRSFPTQVTTASWVVVTGNAPEFAWGIKSDGTLWSWGRNQNGQLAQGDTINRSNPTQIGAATNWTYAATNPNGVTACAINSSGQLWVAGANGSGQLGLNDTANRSSLTQVSGSWTQVIVGPHSLGIDSNYNLYAWGLNNSGQLGNNNVVTRSSPVVIDSGNHYVQIAMGNNLSVAMRDDFTIWAWGSNTNGSLGLNDTINRSNPTQIGTSSWIMVKAHSNGGVAIRNDNTMWSWGSNAAGTLGLNTTGTANARSSPTQIGSGTWKNVTIDDIVVHAVNNLDQLFGWGYNLNGQIGDGTTTGGANGRSSPVQVSLGGLIPTSATQILGASGLNSFFIKTQNADYSLWGTGYGAVGGMGTGDTINRSVPVQINGGLLDQWYAVSNSNGSNSHTVAIKANGTLWAWGYNAQGQLGTNDTINRSFPTQIGTSSNWTILGRIGPNNGAAINSLGQLFVWGQGAFGALGLSSTNNRSSPTQLAGSWTAASISATSYAISDTFKLFSWGAVNGNLGYGDATTIQRSSPTQVGTSSWIQVSGGLGNGGALALRSDRTLWAWGSNSNGQLGLNNTIDRSLPTQVGTSSWTMIDTAQTFAAGITSIGRLFTWGQGNGGRLGLGASDTFSRSSPTQVSSTLSWTNVAVSESVAMALSTTNQLFTWGLNSLGQLGNGTTIVRSSPTLINSGGTPTLEYLLVGGGGGGGGNRGGGGGAGGYVDGTGYTVILGDTITVTVGDSGAASDANSNGGDGGNSSISSTWGGTVTAYGGGGGGNNFTATGGNSINGDNGGSGGGGGMTNAGSGAGIGGKGVYSGSTYISAERQGFDGGAGSTNDTNAGGGGGAMTAGGNATNSVGGNGGRGKQWHDGVTYAGGGGGGADSGGTGGTGGEGGGGAGVTGSTPAVAGGTNTGGGGGGGGANSTSGAAGGTGIVILRYPSVYPVATATTGTPTVTTVNGYRYYKFTGATGSITF